LAQGKLTQIGPKPRRLLVALLSFQSSGSVFWMATATSSHTRLKGCPKNGKGGIKIEAEDARHLWDMLVDSRGKVGGTSMSCVDFRRTLNCFFPITLKEVQTILELDDPLKVLTFEQFYDKIKDNMVVDHNPIDDAFTACADSGRTMVDPEYMERVLASLPTELDVVGVTQESTQEVMSMLLNELREQDGKPPQKNASIRLSDFERLSSFGMEPGRLLKFQHAQLELSEDESVDGNVDGNDDYPGKIVEGGKQILVGGKQILTSGMTLAKKLTNEF